jgi:hypothetical protein
MIEAPWHDMESAGWDPQPKSEKSEKQYRTRGSHACDCIILASAKKKNYFIVARI